MRLLSLVAAIVCMVHAAQAFAPPSLSQLLCLGLQRWDSDSTVIFMANPLAIDGDPYLDLSGARVACRSCRCEPQIMLQIQAPRFWASIIILLGVSNIIRALCFFELCIFAPSLPMTHMPWAQLSDFPEFLQAAMLLCYRNRLTFVFSECNYSCKFCFHTAKTSFVLPLNDAKHGIKLLKDAGTILFSSPIVWYGDVLSSTLSFFLKGMICARDAQDKFLRRRAFPAWQRHVSGRAVQILQEHRHWQRLDHFQRKPHHRGAISFFSQSHNLILIGPENSENLGQPFQYW